MRKVYILFVLATVVFLSNSGLHPSGNTNAPGDSFCGNCHSGSGGAINGDISITGLPNSIMPSTVYQLTVTVNNPAMNASKAGFQILALNQNNSNVGLFTNNSANSALRTQGSRTYLGHNPAVLFNGASSLTWTTDWVSPSSNTGDVITLYGSSVIANGNGSNTGDKSVFSTTSGTITGGGSPLTLIVSADAGTSCSDTNDGRATALPSGGQTPYSYAWDNGETSMQAIGLSSGSHTVTVTDGATNTVSGSVTISSPNPLVLSNGGQEDVSCFDGNDGVAQINASGGTPGYIYDWSDGGSGANRFDLFAGSYQVTVSDFNDCQEIITFNIDQPDEIIAMETITNVQCNGGSNGSIVLNTFGGTGNLLYNWDNGSTTKNLFGLSTGLYNLTITDDNDCTKAFQYQIAEPSTPLFIDLVSAISVTCFGDSDGIAVLTPSGGTGAYTFNWSDGGNGANRNDLAAGLYTVTLSDANDCEEMTTLTIGTPSAISIDSVMSIPASCQGATDGLLEVSSIGGVGNRSYLWSNGGTEAVLSNITSGSYTVSVTDDNNCIQERTLVLGALNAASLTLDSTINTTCNGSSDGFASVNLFNGIGYTTLWSNGVIGDSIQNQVAGIYTVQASDTSGCVSNLLTVQISQPDPIITDSILINMPTCFGDSTGSLLIFPNGGTGAYSYAWSNGDTTNLIENLSSGNYNATITDENMCTLVDTFLLTEPVALVVDSAYILDLLCNSDSSGYIEVLASGGTGNLTYSWSTGDSSISVDMVPAGIYSIQIEDENQCSYNDTFTINEPLSLNVMATVINESSQSLSDGSIALEVNGGTAGYSYLWNTGATTDSIGGLSPSNYKVTVTDANGCTSIKSYTVQSGSCALAVDYSTTDVSCFGFSDGSIILNVTDNLGDVTVIISGGQMDLSNLPSGIYNITVSDTAMCSFNVTDIEIFQPTPIQVTIDAVIPSDASSNGEINITPTGGVSPYTYTWQDSEGNKISTSEDLMNVHAGNYILMLTDANGCTFSSDTIEVPMISGVSDLNNDIHIFPSPVTNVLNVKSAHIINNIELYTTDGNLVRKTRPFSPSFQVDISSLNSGLYLLKLESTKETILTKVIIE